jgi:hypothetical protein
MRYSLPPRIGLPFNHLRFRREPAMTASRTTLIEPIRLIR